MKKIIKTSGEVETFVNSLLTEQKFVIDVKELDPGEGFAVQWIEHKLYTAHDGKEYPDEVWMTRDERFFLVQDLEPEHCRNILRMILLQDRLETDVIKELTKNLDFSASADYVDSGDEEIENDIPEHRVLH